MVELVETEGRDGIGDGGGFAMAEDDIAAGGLPPARPRKASSVSCGNSLG